MISVLNGTPDESVSVSVTNNGFGGNAFYGGGINSPTGVSSSDVEVLQPPGNLYVVDPYLSPLSGSSSISTASVISAINTDYSGVQANGLITDGTATAIAVYASSVDLTVSFTGTGGITFASYTSSFLGSAPAAGSSSCPSDLGLEPTPVIFVHGLWGNSTSLSSTLSALDAEAPWSGFNNSATAVCYSIYLPFDATSGGGSGCAELALVRLFSHPVSLPSGAVYDSSCLLRISAIAKSYPEARFNAG